MKRLILTLAAAAAVSGAAFAQNYMVVDSEKIFKSIDEYNTALTTLDAMAQTYQQQVDARFQKVEALYDAYQSQKEYLSEEERARREQQILDKEQEASSYQEGIFGQEGALMKKRIELIEPIQKRVFGAIERYAKANGFDLVIDKASNPTLLYHSKGVDRTDAVIKNL